MRTRQKFSLFVHVRMMRLLSQIIHRNVTNGCKSAATLSASLGRFFIDRCQGDISRFHYSYF